MPSTYSIKVLIISIKIYNMTVTTIVWPQTINRLGYWNTLPIGPNFSPYIHINLLPFHFPIRYQSVLLKPYILSYISLCLNMSNGFHYAYDTTLNPKSLTLADSQVSAYTCISSSVTTVSLVTIPPLPVIHFFGQQNFSHLRAFKHAVPSVINPCCYLFFGSWLIHCFLRQALPVLPTKLRILF